MSALARYFCEIGVEVYGYDKTKTPLTDQLLKEGVQSISFEDNSDLLPKDLLKKNQNRYLIVYTPAIPNDNQILQFFRTEKYEILKRSEVLGLITKNTKNLSIAGTHGKTTTSCLLSYLMYCADISFVAFLGGIASNFGSNYIHFEDSKKREAVSICEADEFDRSFLKLAPYMAGITSMDADHLDIYGTAENLESSFNDFIDLLPADGTLFHQETLKNKINKTQNAFSYGIEKGEIQAKNLVAKEGYIHFDFSWNEIQFKKLQLAIPGFHNVKNSLLAIAIAIQNGADEASIREGLKSFRGVKRRFEYLIKGPDLTYIDDYAHHPTEIEGTISSIRFLYPTKKITAIFQPHLYSRTKDFMEGFADELSKVDELILLDIYPAREKPIKGVSSAVLLDKITCKKSLLPKEDVVDYLINKDLEVLVSIGAGDIDQLVEPIKVALS